MSRQAFSTGTRTFDNLEPTKQKRVVKAAIDEFSDRGFAGASIRRITSSIGISKGSIFQYFETKEKLFLFVFRHTMDLLKDYLRTVRSETEDLEVFERIRAALLSGVAFVRKNPKIYRVYLRIMFEGGIPMRQDLVHAIRTSSVGYILSILEAGKERGELRSEADLKQAAFLIDALLDRFLQVYGMRHLDADLGLYQAPEETLVQWADGFADILRRGLGP